MSILASNWLKRLVLLLVIMLAAVVAMNQFTPPDAVYFNILPGVIVHYSQTWAVP